MPGFPNLFMTSGPNTGVVVNGSAVFFSECQVEYVLRALRHMFEHGLRSIDCRPGPYVEYNAYIDRGNQTKAWGVAHTSSWYKNRHGRASQTTVLPDTSEGLGHNLRTLVPGWIPADLVA